MAFTLVSGTNPVNNSGSGASPLYTAFPDNTLTNDLLIASVVINDNTSTLNSVAGLTGTNTWTILGPYQNSAASRYYIIWAKQNEDKSGTYYAGLTFSNSLASGYYSRAFAFRGGTSSLGRNILNTNSNAASANPAVTLAGVSANELLFGFASGNSGTLAAGASFTGSTQGGVFMYTMAEYLLDAGAAGDKTVDFVSNSTNWQAVGLSFYTTPPASGPNITSVSTATPREGASLTITGTAFGASQGSGDVKINGVAQTVTSWADTSITVTIVLGTNKFGAAYTVVVRDTSLNSSNSYAGITGLLPANSGLSYVDIGTPNPVPDNRVTAVGDLASGDQLEYDNVGGAVTVATDGTFTVGPGVSSFSCRLWSTGVGYGTSGLQSTGGLPGDRRFLKMSPNIKLGW